jgi:hypothetical protein
MSGTSNEHEISAKVSATIETLKSLLSDPSTLAQLHEDQRIALIAAAGQLSRPTKEEKKERRKAFVKVKKQEINRKDKLARATTGIREARVNSVFKAPLQITEQQTERPRLSSPRNCYVCKAEFVDLHHFYDTMCTPCADLNYQKRFQRASLEGQVAIITGARLKIGYHAALMMLRAGARVIVTTRFPVDAAIRYAKESDFSSWGHRLEIHGLDLRHTPSVEIFTRYIEQTVPRLDILINNAAQTVRRPPGFYAHLMEAEERSFEQLSSDEQKILGSHEKCKQQLNTLCDPAQDSNLPVSWHHRGPGIGLRKA